MIHQIRLEVHEHLRDDVYRDRVRIPEQFRGGIKEGTVCKMSIGANSVLVEVRGIIGENKPIVRLDEKTRNKLNLELNRPYEVRLQPARYPSQFRWAWDASDSAARIAARLSVAGLVFGLVGLSVSVWASFHPRPERDNGRYSYQHQQATAESAESMVVFDTRTGILFGLTQAKDDKGQTQSTWIEINPKTGIAIPRKSHVSN